MRRLTVGLALIGLVAAPALAQSPALTSPALTSPALTGPALATAPNPAAPGSMAAAPLPPLPQSPAAPFPAAAPALTIATPPTCACVQPAPARPTVYRRPVYRRRSAPVPSYSTSITPGPFVFGRPEDVRFQQSAARVGFVEFDTSGYFRGLGPNGTGLLDASITDGIMGGPSGQTGPGPNSIGW